jgi:D-glucosaminate-6-phosphate ammonia-lyase
MDLYDSLGVRKVINGSATLTMLGGSLMPPVVLEAMADAARAFVDLDELQAKAGARLAELTHNEAAYVSCGAAAGMVLAAAACMAGTDAALRGRLPYTDGMQNEFILHTRGRVGYDFAIRQAGGVLVYVGDEAGANEAQFEAAFNERTAGVFVFFKHLLMDGQVPLERQIEIAHRRGVPVIVDAAAQIPPVENLWRYTQLGADLALFSGGKGLCGPQSSGLVLGRNALVEACAFHACPRPFIGRPMKAGKEEIAGLLAAVEWYLGLDHAQVMSDYEAMVAWVVQAFADVEQASARRSFPSEAGQPMPRAEIIFDEAALGITRDALLRRLWEGEPRISLAPAGEGGVFLNPQTLQPGEERVIVEQIKAIMQETI